MLPHPPDVRPRSRLHFFGTLRSVSSCEHQTVTSDADDPDVDRAPICPYCGVTALPADPTHVIDTRFVCENPDCETFGEAFR